MTRRRALLTVAGLVALLVLVAIPAARAADVFGNVAPASQLPSGALADAYPLSRYQLDHHFDAVKAGVFSGVDVSGIPPTIAWLLASIIWQLTSLLASVVITLFTFAFSLDLVNGSAATGGSGALQPVSEAVRSIYRDVFGAPWLTVAVLIAGMWSIWNALVRRRYTETAGALGMSIVFVTIALAFVAWPERTIGTASQWTNQMSGAFLSLSSNGTVTDHDDAKREVGDQLFKTLIYDPWVVLNFGGLEHCVRGDGDEVEPVPVRPFSSNPARDAQLARRLAQGQQIETDNGKVCINHATKYAPHFLRFTIESDQRNAEYEALRDGDSDKLPDEDPGKRDGTYRLGPVDTPAADAMGKSGQYERLGLAVVIFLGELGGFVLLGSLSVAVIVAQVLVLLLLAFAPIALVAAVVPKRGHEFFVGWLQRLAAFLLRKAIYSLVLAVLLAVAAALARATGNLGWLMAFGLQAVFFWAVFIYRRQLTGQLSQAVTGTTGNREKPRLGGVIALYAAARLARRAIRHDGRDNPSSSGGNGDRPQPPSSSSGLTPPPAPIRPAPTPQAADADAPEEEPTAIRSGRPPARDPGAATRTPRREHAAASADAMSSAAPRPASGGRDATSDPGPQTDTAAAELRQVGSAAPAGGHPLHERPGEGGSPAPVDVPAPAPRERPRQGDPAASRPASQRPSGGTTPQRSAADSPLLASLQHDARRLHRDAIRLHEDAQQLAERDAAPAPPPAPRSRPTAGPAIRPETPKGGDGT